MLRIRCRFDHRYTNFIKQENKVNILHDIEKEIIDNIVVSRRNVFGETLNLDGVLYGEKQRFSNREVAFSILSTFGAKTSKLKFHKPSNPCFVENGYSQFIALLKNINKWNDQKKESYIVNSKKLIPPGSSGAYIKMRQENSKLLKNGN